MTDEPRRDVEGELQAGVDAFDAEYFRMFGRYPAESQAPARPRSARRQKVATLARFGATEGERLAAEAALARIDADAHHHRATMDRLDSETYDEGEY